MKFHKIVELLRKEGNSKVAQSKSLSMYNQTIKSLTHWIYKDNSKLLNLARCLKAKDWEVVPKGTMK